MAANAPPVFLDLALPTNDAQAQHLLEAYNAARQHAGHLQDLLMTKEREFYTTVTSMTATIEELRQQLGQPRPLGSMPGVAPPRDFDGDRNHTLSFLRQVRTYLAAHPHHFISDTSKITFMLSYMREGAAAAWADKVSEDLEAASSEGEEHRLATWTTFLEHFRTRFGEVDARHTAQTLLDNLRQESRTVEQLNQEFNNLAPRTGYNETSLLRLYERALKPWIGDAIYRMHPMPTTLEDWQRKAEDLDRQDQTRKAHRAHEIRPNRSRDAGRTSQAVAFPPPAQVTTRTPPPGPIPMDIDRLRRNRACHTCGQQGHLARDCPRQTDPGSYAIRIAKLEEMVARMDAGIGNDVPQDELPEQQQGFQVDQQ